MIVGIDHTQITVPKDKEQEARHFYCEFLGLKETEKPENRRKNGGFWLQAENAQIHVGLEDEVDRTKTKAHVAYRVTNLEKWRGRLTEIGLAVKDSPPFPNAKAFEFRDPFGNRIELIEHF